MTERNLTPVITDRATRLTALMAGHGVTFLQVYAFYTETLGALTPERRAQLAVVMAVMIIGVAAAYLALALPERRGVLRRMLEAVSALLLLAMWVVLGLSIILMT